MLDYFNNQAQPIADNVAITDHEVTTAEPDPCIAPFAGWSYDDNATGWNALLGTGHEHRETDPQADAVRPAITDHSPEELRNCRARAGATCRTVRWRATRSGLA